ncbi:3-oxoacyl-[acyl-carrier-protein] reductase FabG [bacterium HR16]|nr:3-oxoacyl-[acyl-carrier-protein] reductase FabG [bacterium HR16]
MSRHPVALITGGTRGIGLGIARCLAQEGYALALNGVRLPEAVDDVLQELRETGATAEYFQADISQQDERARLVQAVRERFGRLNVLVNNAGVAPQVRADILEASEESFERLIRINLQAPYFLTQAVARWMIEQKQADANFPACIVFITSISATVASPNRGDYCISKAGLSMAAQLWAVRLAEFGIPVYEVRPGIIRTDMTAPVQERYDRLIAEGLTLQPRWGTPEDVGKAVAMLVRGDLPYSTGAVILVDGGLTVARL